MRVPARIRNANLDVQYNWLASNGLLDISKLSLDTLRLYNGADCDVTKRIELDNDGKVSQPLLRLYIDLSFILYRMEPNGPLFDFTQNKKLQVLFPARAEKYLRKLRKLAKNDKLNPGSTPQVFEVLYETLGLEYPFHGKPTTRKEAMRVLAREHPFPKILSKWRTTSRGKSTYIEGYLTCAELNDGRLRTTWWGTGTRTGRLSSGGGRGESRPDLVNLQNIMGDPHVQNQCISDRRWRKVFNGIAQIVKDYPSPDMQAQAEKEVEAYIRTNYPDLKIILALDYGQIEVRVAALMSGDKNLKADCNKSDIHTAVGVTITGWPAEKISKDKKTRTFTKNVHFGILFGSSDEGTYNFVLSATEEDQEPYTRKQVSEGRQRYFRRYPGVQRMIDRQRDFVREHGYVETLFGMRQPVIVREGEDELEGYGEGDEKAGSYWGNQAVNGPVQGSAHQLLVCGLVNLVRQAEKYDALGLPTMDVHDALDFFNVGILDLQKGYKQAKQLMEEESLATVEKDFPDVNWDVPIVTDAEAGLSLGCMVEIDEKTTIGNFMLEWFHKRLEQELALKKELDAVKASPEPTD